MTHTDEELWQWCKFFGRGPEMPWSKIARYAPLHSAEQCVACPRVMACAQLRQAVALEKSAFAVALWVRGEQKRDGRKGGGRDGERFS